MKGVTAIYLGRIVNKDHFRAFVYNAKGEARCVDSWDEFESHMQSGIWFATEEQASTTQPIKSGFESKKRSSKPQSIPQDSDNIAIKDAFLPDERV